MSYTVELLETATDTIRYLNWKDEWHDSSLSWWSEGNGVCDCNRRWFWQDAGNEERDEDTECGDTAYRVVSIYTDDRYLLWSGDANPQ